MQDGELWKAQVLYREKRALLCCPQAWYISCVYPVCYSTPESLWNSCSWYGLLITWWNLGQPPICCLLFPSLNLPHGLTPLYTGGAAHCVAWNTWSIFSGYKKAWLFPRGASAARPELPPSPKHFWGVPQNLEKEREWKESSEVPLVCLGSSGRSCQ